MPENNNQLLVIVSDFISELLKKGEIIDRYYNPGNYFRSVGIILTNSDSVDPEKVQRLVGDATLKIYNLPPPSFTSTLGWNKRLMQQWFDNGTALTRKIHPNLIRVYGNGLNGYLASQIKEQTKIPYLLSMHINPDADIHGRVNTIKDYIVSFFEDRIGTEALVHADIVLPVYKPIVPYLVKRGVKNYDVCYNVINPSQIVTKTDYARKEIFQIVSVGRQIKEKNPENIIKTLKELQNIHFTCVGDGSHHGQLRAVAEAYGVMEKMTFIKNIPNDELCAMLPQFDLFITHTEYWEISKSLLEPMLTGMPIVLNIRNGEPVPELQGDFIHYSRNSVLGYREAIEKMMTDDRYRKSMGKKVFEYAQKYFSPATTENKFVQLYKQYSIPQ